MSVISWLPTGSAGTTPEPEPEPILVNIESAASDTVIISNPRFPTNVEVTTDVNGLGTIELYPGDEYIFTSTVAMNTDGTSNYSKTITFDGSAYTSTLPDGYEQLEYIQSTGTQYIDTGLSLPNGWKLEADFTIIKAVNSDGSNLSTTNTMAGVFGSQNLNGSTWRRNLLGWYSSLEWLIGIGGYATGGSLITGTKLAVECQNIIGKTPYLKINGSTVSTSVLSADTSARASDNCYLMAVNIANTQSIDPSYMKMFDAKVYNSSENLVGHFIPCRRSSDSEVGMYDTVSNSFFANSGTGTFIAGPVAGAPTIKVMPDGALYWYGNECTDVTGGWSFPNITTTNQTLDSITSSLSYGTVTRTKNANNIMLYAKATNGYVARASVHTNNAINMSDASTVKSFYGITQASNLNAGNTSLSGFISVPNGVQFNHFNAGVNVSVSFGYINATEQFDVSNDTSNLYVTSNVGAYNTTGTYYIEKKIDAIWLE